VEKVGYAIENEHGLNHHWRALNTSTYTVRITFTILSSAFLAGLSFFCTGIVCTIPTRKPIRQPKNVPTKAMSSEVPAPLAREPRSFEAETAAFPKN
jgi:hypothetical protein